MNTYPCQGRRRRALFFLQKIGDGRLQPFTEAQAYPPNLGAGKLYVAQENDIFYYLGCAHEGLNENAQARRWFEKATAGEDEPSSAMYYNDQPPEMMFYQGLAWEKLHEPYEAVSVFQRLVD